MAALGRLAALVLAAGVLAAVLAPGARSALFFFFEPTTAKPGDRVTVRTAGTPERFEPRQAARPLQQPLRLYLVRNAIAGKVDSQFDRRLHFVGSLRPDRRGRGALAFTVPPLEAGNYVAAVWCPACRGLRFSVLGVGPGTVARYRPLMLLRIAAPRPTSANCPVTVPNGSSPPGLYGNGLLWTGLPQDGVLRVQPEQVAPDGSMFEKLGWLPTGIRGTLAVQGRRIDAPSAPLRVRTVNWGHSSDGRGSWRSAVDFPSEGCWKLTGRVRDVSLSYVIKVIRARSA